MNRIVSFFKGLTWLGFISLIVMLLGVVLFFFPTLFNLWPTGYPEGSIDDQGVKQERKSKALLVAVAATVVVIASILLSPIIAVVVAVAAVAAVVGMWSWFDYEPTTKPRGGDSLIPNV